MKIKLTAIVALFAGFIGLCTLMGSFYTLDATEAGVKTRMGVIVGEVEPGFGFKAPFIEDVTVYDIKVQNMAFDDVQILSKDLQQANMNLAVNYQIDRLKVQNLYSQVGWDYEEKILQPAVLDTSKAVFGNFTAAESVQNRNQLSKALEDALAAQMGPYGISIRAVQIQNVTFNKQFLDAVEERMQAEVEVQKSQQNLANSKVQADILKTQADAQAYKELAHVRAQAQGINLMNQALAQNDRLVEYTKATRWDGKLPTTMVPGSSVPFLDVTPSK